MAVDAETNAVALARDYMPILMRITQPESETTVRVEVCMGDSNMPLSKYPERRSQATDMKMLLRGAQRGNRTYVLCHHCDVKA
ncbi:hypothetical protein EXIGLDRAFT_726549 [Exidia glandulosa HHB12029]|uniref:Uncharacterized protein n=1 Tax=Exidia glandulosa HHB12029 TaxID=1314781 RepID=A0A165DPP2_EXIGL|nr:hypothetical protein EXIGLDRAFT_726549 [Exidia glandulosa HHB12029]